jgi:putative spermidine/putrescine transport system substrate-binding protein
MKPVNRTVHALSFAALLAATGAQAAPTLYLGMNGGTMERLYADKVLPAFEKANDVKVVIVPGTSSDILAKVQASKDNPQIHVMFLDDGIMYRAISMGLCDTLQDSDGLAAIPAKARIKEQAAAVSLGLQHASVQAERLGGAHLVDGHGRQPLQGKTGVPVAGLLDLRPPWLPDVQSLAGW